jgi:uncharacterized protein (TIGR03435 family)
LRIGQKLLLAAIAAAAVIAPLGFGVLHAAQSGAGSSTPQIVTASFYNPPPLRVYESVSVRLSKSNSPTTPIVDFRPDGLTATNVSLQMLIQQAYGVAPYQIEDAPDWLNQNRYDVEAKVNESLADELAKGDMNRLSAAQQPMLLELLADRFQLSVHRETRKLPAFALVVAKTGSKLHEATPGDTYPNGIKDANGNGHGGVISIHRGGAGVTSFDRGQIIGQGITLDIFIKELSRQLGRPVLDETGLTGTYDFTLQWTDSRAVVREYMVVPGTANPTSNSERLDPPPAQTVEFSGLSIFAALQDQLGLELVESSEQTAPTQILVVDHAEPPATDDQSGSQPQSQAALAFASVSVKPNTTDTPMAGFNIKRRPGQPFSAMIGKPDRFMATNVTLNQLIRTAYGIQDQQIVGGPDWLNSEKFDVDAHIGSSTVDELNKLDPDQSGQQRRNMLQALLTEQFKLATHGETRTLSVYVLTVADSGSKLQIAKLSDTYSNGPKGPGDAPVGPGHWEVEHGKELFQGMPLSSLVQFLSDRLHRTVLDKTGLSGKYDFTLQWTPIPPETSSPSIVSAVHDQLGFQLKLQDSPVEVLVIDGAEQPSQN